MSYLIFFLMLPHMNPPSIEYLWPTLDQIINILRVASAFLIIMLYIVKRRLPAKPLWITALICFWSLMTTCINQGNVRLCVLTNGSILVIALIVDFFSWYPYALVKGLMACFECAIYVNFVSIVFYYPGGMYGTAYYFLGNRNGFILYVLPLLLLSLLYHRMTGKIMRAYTASVVGVLSILVVWSATSVLSLLTFAIVLFLCKVLKKQVTFYKIFYATMAANILVVQVRLMDKIAWIANFIEASLSRTLTLTGRTFIWDGAYAMIAKSPLIGYGVGVRIDGLIIDGRTVPHAHNFWLQCLLEGGIIGLVLFLSLNLAIGKRLSKYPGECNIYCTSVLAALYVMFIAEAQAVKIFYIIFQIVYYANRFNLLVNSNLKNQQIRQSGYPFTSASPTPPTATTKRCQREPAKSGD